VGANDEIVVRLSTPLSDITRETFNRFVPSDTPYLRYEFLAALESSGCVSDKTGWTPQHITVWGSSGHLLAFVPLYLKDHSYGEYVFDWAWADAYQRAGYAYYPKLVSSIPFTPSVSPRVLVDQHDPNTGLYLERIKHALIESCDARHLSSVHILFADPQECPYWQSAEWQKRDGVQYHWFNRDYEDFDGFLAALNSAKRKNIRKERRAVKEAGVRCEWVDGTNLSEEQLLCFLRCYQRTYNVRGQLPYLNEIFFKTLFAEMGALCQLLFAYDSSNQAIASALFLKGSCTLYGRYWGALADYRFLHFELCYYQGIEYCINHGLARFDAGAQGEHKLLRGFQPVITESFHYIRDRQFSGAISGFLGDEREYIEQYKEDAKRWLPYRHDNNETLQSSS